VALSGHNDTGDLLDLRPHMGNAYENVGQLGKLSYRFSFHWVSTPLMGNSCRVQVSGVNGPKNAHKVVCWDELILF